MILIQKGFNFAKVSKIIDNLNQYLKKCFQNNSSPCNATQTFSSNLIKQKYLTLN
jgi:hypothetical protein